MIPSLVEGKAVELSSGREFFGSPGASWQYFRLGLHISSPSNGNVLQVCWASMSGCGVALQYTSSPSAVVKLICAGARNGGRGVFVRGHVWNGCQMNRLWGGLHISSPGHASVLCCWGWVAMSFGGHLMGGMECSWEWYDHWHLFHLQERAGWPCGAMLLLPVVPASPFARVRA